MKVLVISTPTAVAPASGFARAVTEPWNEWNPRDQIHVALLPHQGHGMLESVTALGFQSRTAVTAHMDGTVVIDANLALAGEGFGGTTAPLADPLLAALEAGARSIVVAAGPSPVHDGGKGLLDALVARFGSVAGTRAEFAGTELVLATSENLALTGLHGAGAALADAVGADEAQQRDSAVAAWAASIERDHAPTDLTTGKPLRLSGVPGSGLAGGAGFALLLLGARSVSAVEWVAGAAGLRPRIEEADLVVVTLDSLDAITLENSALSAAAEMCLAEAIPLIAIVSEDMTSRRARAEHGIVGVYLTDENSPVAGNTFTPEGVEEVVRRVARTWSRP